MKKVLLGICVSILAMFTYGEVNAESVSLEMPTVVMGAPQDSTDNYYVTLESLNANNPMPTQDKKMTIAVKGNSEGNFGSVTYTEPGYYYYKFYQDKMNIKNIKYDKTTYDLVVQIVKEEGGVLKASTSLKKTGSDIKSTVVAFSNNKIAPSKIKYKKTPKVIKNPYTGDKIMKYFIISMCSIILILIIIIYVKNSREDD